MIWIIKKTWKTLMEECYLSKVQSATLLKVTFLHVCSSRFLNYTYGTKSRKVSISITVDPSSWLTYFWPMFPFYTPFLARNSLITSYALELPYFLPYCVYVVIILRRRKVGHIWWKLVLKFPKLFVNSLRYTC